MQIFSKKMKKSALILAGGFGTRLRSIYPDIPKPLVEINGTPILHHCIMQCIKYGFTDILISVHYQADKIRENVSRSYLNLKANIDFIYELEPIGTGGALQLSLPQMRDDFLILYSDIYSDINLRHLINFHTSNQSEFTTVVHPNNHPFDSDIIIFKKNNNRVYGVSSHKTRGINATLPNVVNAALYAVNKKVIPEDIRSWDIAQNIIPYLLSVKRRIYAYETLEYLKDMGSPERLRQVEEDIINGKVLARNQKFNKKAIFLDRDGCLNMHCGYIKNATDLKLEKGVSEALSKINKSQFVSFCVTNQPIIARGELLEEELDYIHDHLETKLGKNGAFLDGIEYCPHHPDKGFVGENSSLKTICKCRKPEPGMLLSLSDKWNLDLSNSWMIGDTLRDIGAGEAAGCWTILLSGGDQKKQCGLTTNPPDFIFPDLLNATEFILGPFNKLYKQAMQVAATIIASNKEYIVISGMSRSGKTTFASILRRVLKTKNIANEVFSTDSFLELSKSQHSRKFNNKLAKVALSKLDKNFLGDMRSSFHIHEIGVDIECRAISFVKNEVLIIEGENIPYIDEKEIFHIRIGVCEYERFKRFKAKYLLRGLSNQEINNLYSTRGEKKYHFPKLIDLELML